jgi:hypothetical protein
MPALRPEMPGREASPLRRLVEAWNRRSSLVFWVLFGSLAVISVVPLFAVDLIPGVDYPTHLSMIRILRYALEDPAAFHATYGTRLWQPYWGFYAPVLLLSSVVSIDLAAKIVLALTILMQPVAVLLLARRTGANPAVSLLSFALAYSFLFYWGFLPFLVAMNVGLLGLLPALRYSERPTDRGLVVLALVSFAVFACHATAWVFWVAWTGWIFLTREEGISGRFVLRVAAVYAVPAVLLVAYNSQLESWGNLAWIRDNPAVHSELDKARNFSRNVIPSLSKRLEHFLVLLFTAGAGLSFVGRLRAGDGRRLLRWGGAGFFMFLGYWFLPQDVAGVSFMYQRCLAFAFLFLLLGSVSRPALGTTLVLPYAALAGVVITCHALIFAGFNEEMSGLRACLATAKPRTTLVGLMFDRDSTATFQPLFLHADNYHTYWNLGRVYAHSMDMLPTTPVYYRNAGVFGRIRPAFDWVPWTFDYAQMGTNVRYFLIHAREEYRIPGAPNMKTDAFLLKREGVENTRLVCSDGLWRLYENLEEAGRSGTRDDGLDERRRAQ